MVNEQITLKIDLKTSQQSIDLNDLLKRNFKT